MDKTVDLIIDQYAEELRTIYTNQTAGDYTFEGVLMTFLREVDEVRKPTMPTMPTELTNLLNTFTGKGKL